MTSLLAARCRRASLLVLFPAVAAAAAAVLWPGAVSFASWSSPGSGTGAGLSESVPSDAAPSMTVVRNVVTVSWPAVTLRDGTPVTGYLITRYDASTGSMQVVGPGCSGVVTTTACSEQTVPPGSWIYTTTPVLANWRGASSPPGGPVHVA